MFYVPQIQNDDCGFACLKMLLANIHDDRNYLYLPQDEEHGLYSYDDLVNIASLYGVTLEGYRISNKGEVTSNTSYPFIATIEVGEASPHAVMIYRIKHKRVYYLDPSQGRCSLPLKKFLSIWDGTMLLIIDYEKQPCPFHEEKILKNSQHIYFCLMQLLVGIAVVLGVYFIGGDVYVFIPIIFFSLAVIFELLTKVYSLSLMKKIDSYFFSNVHVRGKKYKSTLIRFERYKKGLLASPLSLLLSFLVAFCLMMVVVQNDSHNIVLIISSFLVAASEVLLYRPLIQKEIIDISHRENALDNCQDDDTYKEKVGIIHQKAYRIGLIEISKNCIGLALFIATAIIIVAGQHLASFPHVVFYFAIQLALYHSYHKMFSYPDDFKDLQKAKVEINNCLHQ